MSTSTTLDGEPTQTFEWTNPDGPSGTLVTAVSEVVEKDPVDMEPLYDVVDADALDALFASTRRPGGRLDGSVQFEYCGHWIVVNANGRGYIYERGEAGHRSEAATTSPGRAVID